MSRQRSGPGARASLARLSRALARVDGDAIDREDRVPPRALAALKAAGAFRLTLPRAHGGLGLSQAAYHAALAALSARSAGLATSVAAHLGLAAAAIARAGTAEQRAALLPRLAAGELGALAVSEAEAGSEPARVATTARRARGGWRLDGRKLWITNARAARWLVVLARAPGGPTAFVVDARSRGVRVEAACRFAGLRGCGNAVVALRGVLVPDPRRLGAEGEGLGVVLGALAAGRLSVAARGLGLARECRRAARAWSRARRVRGGRLSDLPSAAALLARLDALVAELEALSARGAALAQAGVVAPRESALLKVRAAEAAFEAADLALRLRGPRGYETADSQRARGEAPEPVERWWRDARGLRAIEGSEDVLRAFLARG